MVSTIRPTEVSRTPPPAPGLPEAWWDTIEDPEGYRLEIIRGELSVTPSATPAHHIAQARLIRALDAPGHIPVTDLEWRLTTGSRVARAPRPDVMVIPVDTVRTMTDPPLLAIEVLSPSDFHRFGTTDLTRIEGKRLDYADGELAHYLELELPPVGGPRITRYERRLIEIDSGDGTIETTARLVAVEVVEGHEVLRATVPFPYELRPSAL